MLLDERLKTRRQRWAESATDVIAPNGLAQLNGLQKLLEIDEHLSRRFARVAADSTLLREAGQKLALHSESLRNALKEGIAAIRLRRNWRGPQSLETYATNQAEFRREMQERLKSSGLDPSFGSDPADAHEHGSYFDRRLNQTPEQARLSDITTLHDNNATIRVAIKILRTCEHLEKNPSSEWASFAWDRFSSGPSANFHRNMLVTGVVLATVLEPASPQSLQDLLKESEGAFPKILPNPNPFRGKPQLPHPALNRAATILNNVIKGLLDVSDQLMRPEKLEILISNVEPVIREAMRIGGGDFYSQFRQELPENLGYMRIWNEGKRERFVKTIDDLMVFAQLPFKGGKLDEDSVVNTEFSGLKKRSLQATALFVFCLLNRIVCQLDGEEGSGRAAAEA